MKHVKSTPAVRLKRHLDRESSRDWELNVHVIVPETKHSKSRTKKIGYENSPSQPSEKNVKSNKAEEDFLEYGEFDAYIVPKFEIFVKYMKEVRKQNNNKNRNSRSSLIDGIKGLD